MKWRDILAEYRVGLRHNPKQFMPNSFRPESAPGGRVLIVGRVKRHVGKNFRVVAVVKDGR